MRRWQFGASIGFGKLIAPGLVDLGRRKRSPYERVGL